MVEKNKPLIHLKTHNIFILSVYFILGVSLYGKKNVFLCLSQTHAISSITSYGGRYQEFNVTPHLDRIAADGVLFKNAFTSQGSAKLTLATILTRTEPTHAKFDTNGLDDTQSIQRLFKRDGYQTAFFGKWPFENLPKNFDYWEISTATDQIYNPEIISPHSTYEIEGHATDVITDRAISWINQQTKTEKPIFIITLFHGTLKPWIPPIRFLELYNDRLLPEPKTLKTDYLSKAPPSRYQEVEILRNLDLASDLFVETDEESEGDDKSLNLAKPSPFDRLNDEQLSAWQLGIRPQNEAFTRINQDSAEALNWKYQRFVKNYLRCVHAIDENIGRLYDIIMQENITNNWTFMYSACQGNFLGENGWFGGNWIYEPAIRIPLIITGDKYPKNKKSDFTIHLADIYPTLLTYKSSKTSDGGNFPIMLDTNGSDTTRNLYFEHSIFPDISMVAKHYGIRTARHKLIHYHQFDEWELFDLGEDPDEQNNIFERTENESLVNDLTKLLLFERRKQGYDNFKEPMPEEWRRIYRGPNARKKERIGQP